MNQNIQGKWLRFKHALRSLSVTSYTLIFLQARKAKRSRISGRVSALPGAAESHLCHLMVVNSMIYILLSEICINSFLEFNPNSRFVIHTDSKLFRILRRRFSSLIRDGRVEVKCSVTDASDWQRSKLEIILSMCGSKEIFMDADLRWNGTLTMGSDIVLYLKEFALGESELYRKAFPALNLGRDVFMYNLSFISFAGFDLSEIEMAEILGLQSDIANFSAVGIDSADVAAIRRMSEQLALSIALCRLELPIKTLKSSDERNDGRFVESCYFGATGLAF